MEERSLYNDEVGEFSLCRQVQEQLPELVEGYLDAVAAEAVRAHVAVCFICARELREIEITIRVVETLPFFETSRDFAPSIMAAIDVQTRRPWYRWRPRLRGR
jgi:hypothetical protein